MAYPRREAEWRAGVKREQEDAASEQAEAARRPRGGRPTRAAAAERDERLLEIATAMFMEHGFEATSMDRLAEAASIGKATLYARYADKAALFADVLRRRIPQVYEPLEQEFARPLPGDLEDTLLRIAEQLLDKSLSPGAVALGRILAAQGPNFPDLASLFIREGLGRQLRLVETVLARFKNDARYALDDLPLAAALFLAVALGRASRLATYGFVPDPAELRRRTAAAVRVFVRGIAVTEAPGVGAP